MTTTTTTVIMNAIIGYLQQNKQRARDWGMWIDDGSRTLKTGKQIDRQTGDTETDMADVTRALASMVDRRSVRRKIEED